VSESTALTIPAPVSLPGIRQDQYDRQEAFRQQLEANLPQIMAALPKGVRAEVMTSVAMTAALDNPALLDCTPLSMFRSVLKMASLGLRHGETCDLVPIKGKAECWVRVRGIVELAMRAGSIKWAKEGFVCEGDTFEFEERAEGTHFRHVPLGTPKHDGSNVTHIYALVTLPNGSRVFEVWTKDRVLAHKAKNVRNIKQDSPWNTHPLAMMAKTVIKQALRFASLSPELRTAIAAGDDVGEGTFEVMPTAGDPTKALAAVSGSLDQLERMDTAIIEDDEPTRMTLDQALAYTVNGKRLAELTDAQLAAVLDSARAKGNAARQLAAEIVIGARADAEATDELAEAA